MIISRTNRRGLGTVSTDVNGNLIYGSDPIQPVTTTTTVASSNWPFMGSGPVLQGGTPPGFYDGSSPITPWSPWDWFMSVWRPRERRCGCWRRM